MTGDNNLYVCSCTESHPSLVEEAVLNPAALPPSLRSWRRYRIEYGFECGCPEGIIYLPPDVDSEIIERELNKDLKKPSALKKSVTIRNPVWVCTHTKTHPLLVQEFGMDYDELPPSMQGWRRFRIQYGFECSCPEGLIYLPPSADTDVITDALTSHLQSENKKG